MPPKKAEDDLLAELDSLGIEQEAPAKTTTNTRKAAATTASNAPAASAQDDEDAFAEIEKQLAAKKTSSRPSTPRLSSSTTTTTAGTAKATPASTSVGSSQRNSSEDRATRTQAPARSSVEGGRSFHQSQTAEDETPAKAAATGGGWWGSMYSAASAAVKQAETIAKEIRSNEEAQKWATQVRGNLSNLQSIGEPCLYLNACLVHTDIACRHRSPHSCNANIHISHISHRTSHIGT